MTTQQRWQKLSDRLDEISAYERSLGKLEFDMACCAPPQGLRQAGEDMSQLGRQMYRLTHSRGYRELLEALHQDSEGLNDAQKRVVQMLCCVVTVRLSSCFPRRGGGWTRTKASVPLREPRDCMIKSAMLSSSSPLKA